MRPEHSRKPPLALPDLHRHPLREMLEAEGRPGITSFALGLPPCDLLPRERYAEAVGGVLADDPLALQLGPPFAPLRRSIAALMRRRGVVCEAGQVFLTSGAQQGIDLVARSLVGPGATVVVEEVAYPGLMKALEPHRPRVLTVPSDPASGVDVAAVRALLEGGERPVFMYLVPDGHNPLGVSIDEPRRAALVELAREYGFFIVEDDVYGLLDHGGEPLAPSLRALDDDCVIYLGSFSKVLGPALRTGWMVVPEALLPVLSALKDLADIDACTLHQRAVERFIASGAFDALLERLRLAYSERTAALSAALRRHLPALARWHEPRCGLFLWVRLPAGLDTTRLWRSAVERERVNFIPGAVFAVGAPGPAASCMRLSLSCAPEQVEDGVARLARAIERELGTQSKDTP